MIMAYLISNQQFNIWNISYITSQCLNVVHLETAFGDEFCGNLKEIRRGLLVQQNWGLYLSTFLYFTVQRTIVQYFTIFQSRNRFAIYYIYRIAPTYLPFSEVHTPLRVSEISSELILYITSALYLFSPRLMQLNIWHTLHSWHEILTHSPTYWIFPPDFSQFAGCFLLQSMTIPIYFCLSPNHAIICFTSSVT